MARPVWRGSITFGLVTIPVELYSATQDHAFHFSQYERGTGDRIRYRRVNERTGKEVDDHDIVKGYEFDDGELVLVDQDELAEIAPGRSRTIDIDAFVDLAEIDPVYFQKSYWLAPASSEHRRAYALLLRAMEQSGRAGIARFVMRAKEYVAALSRSVQNRDSRGSETRKSGKDGKRRKYGKGERAEEANEAARDYRELTKQQLESRARDLEVRGRSKLNRAQLAEAVSEAEANEGGREAS